MRTLHTSALLSARGTIRGGSFLSAVLAAILLRRWLLTAGSVPSIGS
ncbi:MAG TPA: hypothetical protein VNA88_13855 [Candidatus Kapabacteria bacterium]|nr:hypothetical protein [Candidatus Kapabacteria bacterium]